MNKLSKRLELLSTYVEDGSKVIDIGCDHAYLDIYLVQEIKNIKVIANDINESALDNARLNIKKCNLVDKIDIRLGNGLEVINNDEIDTIITSGLGAHTIVGILLNNKDKLVNVNNIIIQSNTDIEFLRKKVISLNYYIVNEDLVKDKNIIYTIIKFKKGKRKYFKKELFFGPILLKKNNDLFKEKNKKELQKLELLLNIIPKSKYIYRYNIKKKISMYKKIFN